MANLGEEEAQKEFLEGWRIFATLQNLFPIRWLARLLFTLRPYLPPTIAEAAPLFYAPQLMAQAETLTNTLLYTHPISGEPKRTTLNCLIEEAAAESENLCRQLESAVFDKEALCLDELGPAMDSGLSGVGTKGMRHFSSVPFPRLD